MERIPKEYKGMMRSAYYVAKVIGWAFMYSIIVRYSVDLNPEDLIDNWAVGIIGVIIFSTLFIIPEDISIWFRFNRFYKFWILFWLAWFIADYQDYIVELVRLFGAG